jgi:hypothetical protein
MRDDIGDERHEISSSEELIDPDLENEEEEARREYGQSEDRPQLTLVKPADQNIEIDLPDEDPPVWPEF